MVPLVNARILWLNRRAMREDPQFAQAGDEVAYEQHLLKSCAFSIADNTQDRTTSQEAPTAVADRYGGIGIGRNGGSGRAVVVNGYQVKGIGRTPLASVLADPAHTSGRSYLEECVRETVFSELVDAEFPFGAVPTLAIVETGLFQTWHSDNGAKPERQCLLVRPAFMRPAHFTRATEHHDNDPKEGFRDAMRVAHMLRTSADLFGQDRLIGEWRQLWLNWAEQLAYAYVHRLNLSGNSESNIAWDGKLLDFGAMTALPSWARINTIQGGPPSGMDMLYLMEAFKAIMPFFARHVNADLASEKQITATLAQVTDRYRRTVVREVLRTVGLTRTQCSQLLRTSLANRIASAVNRLVTHFAREQFAIFDGTPEPRIRWDLDQFWSDRPPAHARELQTILREAIVLGLLADSGTDVTRKNLAELSEFRQRTRHELFRDRIKPRLYPELDGRFPGDTLTPAMVARVIDEWVTRNRRDCKVEPSAAVPIGFSRSSRSGHALFRCANTNQLFGIEEWCSSSEAPNPSVRVPVTEIGEEYVQFADDKTAAQVTAYSSTHLPYKP